MYKELSPLEALERIKNAPTIYVGCASDIYTRYSFECKEIETALKALEIIKEHRMIWFDYLLNCKSVDEYNKTILDYYDNDKETCEQFFLLSWEFDLLKEVLREVLK